MHIEWSVIKQTNEELSARLRNVESKLKEAKESLETRGLEDVQVLNRGLQEQLKEKKDLYSKVPIRGQRWQKQKYNEWKTNCNSHLCVNVRAGLIYSNPNLRTCSHVGYNVDGVGRLCQQIPNVALATTQRQTRSMSHNHGEVGLQLDEDNVLVVVMMRMRPDKTLLVHRMGLKMMA